MTVVVLHFDFIFCCLFSVPISSFAASPVGAGESLRPCLDKAVTESLPNSARALTPIYLGATAGMRLLKWVRTMTVRQLQSFVYNMLKISASQWFTLEWGVWRCRASKLLFDRNLIGYYSQLVRLFVALWVCFSVCPQFSQPISITLGGYVGQCSGQYRFSSQPPAPPSGGDINENPSFFQFSGFDFLKICRVELESWDFSAATSGDYLSVLCHPFFSIYYSFRIAALQKRTVEISRNHVYRCCPLAVVATVAKLGGCMQLTRCYTFGHLTVDRSFVAVQGSLYAALSGRECGTV
jgi:hypothetical protein